MNGGCTNDYLGVGWDGTGGIDVGDELFEGGDGAITLPVAADEVGSGAVGGGGASGGALGAGAGCSKGHDCNDIGWDKRIMSSIASLQIPPNPNRLDDDESMTMEI